MDVRENVRQAIVWIIDTYENANGSAFARRIGVSRQIVSNWIHGYRSPEIETVALICRTYGVDADWMILGDSND